MARAQRLEGRLGDLAEIPWGTPDADRLLRLLRHEYGQAALDHAAAEGTLRQLCARTKAASELAALLDRPQKVRHAFRGELDWGDPAVTDVFRALVAVFNEDGSSEDVCRLAGVDLAGVDLDRPATEVWHEVMTSAAHQGTLEKLIDQTLTDVAVGTYHDVLEGARDQPWRLDGDSARARPLRAPPQPITPPIHASVEVAHTATGLGSIPELDPHGTELTGIEAPRRGVAGIALILGLGAGFGLGWAAGDAARPPPAKELPPPVLVPVREPVSAPPPVPKEPLAGAVTLAKGKGRLVLTRDGAPVEAVPAAKPFAFAPQPLDADGDGAIDPTWGVRLELSSAPCPGWPLELQRDADAQVWKVPAAAAVTRAPEVPAESESEAADAKRCRIEVRGLDGIAVGAVVELDPGVVHPRRFAVVEEVKRGVATAVAVGEWDTCAACWPVVGMCEEAAAVGTAAPDAKLLLERATCPDEVKERLKALAPAPKPRPQPRPAPSRRRR